MEKDNKKNLDHNNVQQWQYFNSLNKNTLVSLIKCDDLQIEEVKIWNNIIKWDIAQNHDLPSNSEDWSDENFTTLKDTLKNFLPHICYFQMSAKDVADYVVLYSQILEKRLWKDLNKKKSINIGPIDLKIEIQSQTEPFFSTVINEEHAAEIASWIDKNTGTYSIRNNPYEFTLLFRGSRDGFTRESFWNLCNMKANTVTVINVRGSDNIERIFGGYNPVAWNNSKKGWQLFHRQSLHRHPISPTDYSPTSSFYRQKKLVGEMYFGEMYCW
ncbi:hypothetical protein C2G38_2222128 [Gigaspora rosea]|uniref:TLDc domain-containing protein n=1 Tax=Gigaspora rosea TaxID=44941 RepID=A0A397UB55_9GLOM|nr:hypothetical protein C2G38_2222128 [Gigaspora rosea]